jgi:hypothetical protein
MEQELVSESVNYDYLPGEPESRKTWYITLRFPPQRSLTPGMIIKFNSSNSPSSIMKDGHYFVIDIHGRHVVVEPIFYDVFKLRNMKVFNVNSGPNSFIYEPQIPHKFNDFPRVGRTLYAERPLVQDPCEKSYLYTF